MEQDGNTVTVEILNKGLQNKVGYDKPISYENFHKARRFATQNRSFFPLPLHLLSVNKHPPFKKYTLNKK